MVLLDEEFGNGLTGWSWFLGSFMRLQSRCQIGLHSSEGLSGAEGAFLRWPFHIDGRFVMAVGRTLSTELPKCPHNMVADFSQSK